MCQTKISIEKFLNEDNELNPCGTITDEGIASSIKTEISDEKTADLQY